MPSIFTRSAGSKKTKNKVKGNAGNGNGSLPLTRTTSGANGSLALPSPRPDSGFKKVNGYRQEVGEFGTRTNTAQYPGPKQNLPLTPPDSPTAFTGSPPLLPPKHVFSPTHVPSETPSSNSIDSFAYSSDDVTGLRPYGILGGVGSKVTLGLEDVGKVVRDVGAELDRRGLTTPLLFSSQALELNQTRVKMLVNAYIDTLGVRSLNRHNQRSARNQESFSQDLRFAKEHELAWLLRWALSRVTRVREGTKDISHGLMEWETYEEWRGRERAANYPADAFPYLSAIIPAELYHQVVTPLFQLLSRFAAHSHLSGLTPHALSSLFAPLLFDIPTSQPAMAAHATFVRAASATEHLILAFIRSQSASKSELGVKDLPTRLREWVVNYPAMLATDADLARGSPRRGARVVRCDRVSRAVRAYTRDLVVGAELWASDLPDEQKWETWERVTWKNRRTEVSRPKFSPAWKRKMAVKETLPLPASAGDHVGGLNRQTTYGKAKPPGRRDDRRDRERKKSDEEEARYGSLAGKEWSMFEEGGFDTPSEFGQNDIKARLQFDLTESAKTNISIRRETMDWTQFASEGGGFSRTDPHLAVSLAFSEPLANSITSWPSERDALQRKLHKSQKEATPFHHDTSIRLGAAVEADQGETNDDKGRVWIEEAFVDCWADLMMGAGWIERDELTFKETNWALIEYRAKPSRPDSLPQDPLADPRTADVCILFEERVPLEYQMAIANPQEKKRFANLFSSRSRRRDQAPTASARHHDFDKMLMQRSTTKRVTLGQQKESNTVWHREPPVSPTSGQTTPRPTAPVRKRTKSAINNNSSSNDRAEIDPKMHDGKASFFSKNRVARRVKTNEDNRGRARRDREHEVEFELHSASGISSGGNSPNERDGMPKKPKDDEKWMDILIANGARRMDRQDALAPPKMLSPASAAAATPTSPRRKAVALPSEVLSGTGQRDPSHRPPALEHTPELTRDRSADDEAHSIEPATPRASGFSDPSRQSAEEEQRPVPDPYEHEPARGRRAHPTSGPSEHSHRSSGEGNEIDPYAHGLTQRHRDPNATYSYSYSDDTPPSQIRSSDDFTSRSSMDNGDERERISFSSQHREVPLVAPIPVRDTIHGIVSHYGRDHQDSMISYDSEYDDNSQATISMSPASGGQALRQSGDEERDQLEELHSPVQPPAPLFDLTPGREPSPMRYKHGEPLQFVNEADETQSNV